MNLFSEDGVTAPPASCSPLRAGPGVSEGRSVGGITPVRLTHQTEAALDAAVGNQRDVSSRSELMGRIVTEWLTAKGYLRNAQSDQGLRPDELNSENDG
ncbi:MAG TPA: hypothetical protein VGO18_38840 [Steroidobacteraceae bacterium]|jgi:hypothetical protein|nr:hypothetical protein [Steroidobacteraceae bacterium]